MWKKGLGQDEGPRLGSREHSGALSRGLTLVFSAPSMLCGGSWVPI